MFLDKWFFLAVNYCQPFCQIVSIIYIVLILTPFPFHIEYDNTQIVYSFLY